MASQLKLRTPPPTSGGRVAAGLGLAAAAGGGLLAGLQQSLIGGLLALGLGVVSFRVALRARRPLAESGPAAPLIDAAQLAALDAVLETLAPQLPEPALAMLIDTKEHIAWLSAQPREADDLFTLEDALYVNECVRRYLPDTLQAYIDVPVGQRTMATPTGQSADELLLDQLGLLCGALLQRRTQLAARATQALASQQRFLQAKSKD